MSRLWLSALGFVALGACAPTEPAAAPVVEVTPTSTPPAGYGNEDPVQPAPVEANAPTPDAEPLLNALLGELQRNGGDFDAAIRGATPLLHRSLLTQDGMSVTADLRTFSFKKAFDNARLYDVPVRVTRMRPSNVTGIGIGPTAERGHIVDYFVAKRNGVPGLPAPVSVFFPDGGGPPKIAYVGSL